MRTDRSLLDFVAGDLKHLEGGLGDARSGASWTSISSDVREIERRIQRAEQQAQRAPPTCRTRRSACPRRTSITWR